MSDISANGNMDSAWNVLRTAAASAGDEALSAAEKGACSRAFHFWVNKLF